MFQFLLRNLQILACLVLCTACFNQVDKNKNQSAQKAESFQHDQKPLFEQVPSSHSSIEFTNKLTETAGLNIINYHYFYNGGGVACGDINNDGLADLYFTANQLPDKLYLNKGNLQFEDISHVLPAHQPSSWHTGVTMADVNADGLLDIYVCRSGKLPPDQRRNLLLINQGNLSFAEKAHEYGLDDAAYSTQAAFFDYDKDGDLDMYLLNHEIKDITNYNREIRKTARDPNVGDKLYRNEGQTFVEVGKQAGINASPYGFGLGVAIGDINNDNWPDIYVTNDFLENDFLYINNRDGSFTESIKSATKHISNYGMGVDIADMNNDGLPDILVADMVARDNYRQKANMSGMNPEKFWQSIQFGFHYQYMYNTLQLNQGREKFSEVGQMAGISNTDWSWATLMADFNNDGNKDILITNGLRKDVRNNDFVKEHILNADQLPQNKGLDSLSIIRKQLRNMPSQRVSNYIFKNHGHIRFSDKSTEWGIGVPSFSTGAIYADLDNDGDLDLAVNNVDDEALIFANKNNETVQNHFLHVKLKGPPKNPFGIGAKIILKTDSGQQTQEIFQTRGFQSSVPPIGYFGVGKSVKIQSLGVRWPDGKHSIIAQPAPNQLLDVDYNDARTTVETQETPPALFTDVTASHGLHYSHVENFYDDFKDQVLLPHKLSTLGPALAVADVDGDGLEDFVVGGAHGFAALLYKQSADGQFREVKIPALENHRNFEDIDAIFFDADGDGDPDLYMASGGYEFDITSPNLQDRLYLNDGKGNFTYEKNYLPDFKVSTGCVKPFDMDGDGDLDLFVGGRLQPKHYPLSPRSYLLQNNGGKFTDATAALAPELENTGMVTDAEWMDVDGDGQVDLVVAGEWMPITIFKGRPGRLELADAKALGLEKTQGWWFSLQKVDFDGDGDLDLLGGNLGLNYKYKATEDEPFKVFAEDFDNNHTVDIVLSYSQRGVYYPVRGRECSSQQMPFIKEKFPDYKSFASASVKEVLGGEKIEKSLELNAYTFASTIFENTGKGFTTKSLDHRAQFSSVNDFVIDDLNGDGSPDIILAGNLFGSEVETPRNDAGYGLILMGTNKDGFTPIPTSQSSFFGEGDVKKIRAIKIGKGYTAYLVVQNSGPLRLFRFQDKPRTTANL